MSLPATAARAEFPELQRMDRLYRYMFQPYELFVGLRYTRAKRRNHFISFISLVSIIGIFLGVTALITVTSVMNGFEKEMRQRIIGASSHATVSGLGEPIADWEPVASIATAHPEVNGAAPYVEGQVMVVHAGRSTGALVRGILPEQEPKVSELHTKLEQVDSLEEALPPGEFGLLLGADLAAYLGAIAGDKVMVRGQRDSSWICSPNQTLHCDRNFPVRNVSV